MSTVQDQVQKSLKLVGRVLGDKFKLTACIGIGGSGAVYKADQMALGRTVAVKILNEELCADPRMITRFRGEAMSASRLNHPNCVSIIDYGQSPDGLLYLAMEYVKGPTLTQLLQNENPLGVERVVDIVSQSLAGIEEAHLAGVVHADLKSDNIIVDQRRANIDTVKIVASRLRNDEGFERRRRSGMGRFITEADFKRFPVIETSDFFKRLPGFRHDGSREQLQMRGAFGWCAPAIFIDGHELSFMAAEDIDDWVPPHKVRGIEVYSEGTAPPQFHPGLRGCGSIVVWTK